LPGFDISLWHGLWLPKGTPKNIIAKVNAAVMEAFGRSDGEDTAGGTGAEDRSFLLPNRCDQSMSVIGSLHGRIFSLSTGLTLG
jgi:hypothetical protein